MSNEGKILNNAAIVLTVAVLILSVMITLLMSGYLNFDFRSNNKQNITNNNDSSDTDYIKVDGSVQPVEIKECKNYESTLNGITVKVLQEKSNDTMECITKELNINDKKVETHIYVTSYEIFYNNVIINTGDTSGSNIKIYNVDSESIIMNLNPNTLDGYWAKSYIIEGNNVRISGKYCGAQCGGEDIYGLSCEEIENQKSNIYPEAIFEIEYNNGFSEPKMISKTSIEENENLFNQYYGRCK